MSFLDRLKTKIAEAPAPSGGFEGDPGRPFRRYASAFGGFEGVQGRGVSPDAAFEDALRERFSQEEALSEDPNAPLKATLELLQTKEKSQVHTRSRAEIPLPGQPSKPPEGSTRAWTGAVSRSWADNPLIAEVDREILANRALRARERRGPREWVDGVASLDRWVPPCPGFHAGEWETIGRTIRHFMAHYAEEAACLGWTALDLFAVHPRVGAVRVDCCGALMLPATSHVTALSAHAITFGPVVYRRRLLDEAVLAWEFRR